MTPYGDFGKRPRRVQGITAQFRWHNHEVEFFFRRYKNSQAVAELQARIFVKYEGKGASECANRELRDDASKKIPPRADSGKGSALGGIVTGSAISFSFGKVQVPRGQKRVRFRRRTNIRVFVRRVTGRNPFRILLLISIRIRDSLRIRVSLRIRISLRIRVSIQNRRLRRRAVLQTPTAESARIPYKRNRCWCRRGNVCRRAKASMPEADARRTL